MTATKKQIPMNDEKFVKVEVPPSLAKSSPTKRLLVFVDPDDSSFEWWWPAIVVPKEELKLFKSTVDVNDVILPKADEYLVVYFEDGSFSTVPQSDTVPFSPLDPPYTTYCLSPSHEKYENDKAINLATQYWQTGIFPETFGWLKNLPIEDRTKCETFKLVEMLDKVREQRKVLIAQYLEMKQNINEEAKLRKRKGVSEVSSAKNRETSLEDTPNVINNRAETSPRVQAELIESPTRLANTIKFSKNIIKRTRSVDKLSRRTDETHSEKLRSRSVSPSHHTSKNKKRALDAINSIEKYLEENSTAFEIIKKHESIPNTKPDDEHETQTPETDRTELDYTEYAVQYIKNSDKLHNGEVREVIPIFENSSRLIGIEQTRIASDLNINVDGIIHPEDSMSVLLTDDSIEEVDSLDVKYEDVESVVDDLKTIKSSLLDHSAESVAISTEKNVTNSINIVENRGISNPQNRSTSE